MASRYAVVARTYFGWPLAGALVALLVPVCLAAVRHPGVTDLIAYTYLTLGFFAFSLGTRVKEQFANPRASLLPDFRRPHLAVPAALAVTVLVLVTVTIWRIGGTALPGTTAVVLVIFTAFVWWAYWPTWTWATAVGILFAIAFPQPRSVFTALAEGQAVLVSVLLTLVCAALLKTLVARLMRLDEELPEYHVPLLTRLSSTRQEDVRRAWSTWGQRDVQQPVYLFRDQPSEAGGIWRPQPQVAERPSPSTWGQTGAQPGLFIRSVPQVKAGSFWGRVRLWRFGMTDRVDEAIVLVGLPVMLVCWYLFANRARLSVRGTVDVPILFGLIFSVGPPVRWLQRWPRLGYELLRPTTRRDFCRQMGLAFACEVFERQLGLVLISGCALAIWAPGVLRTWDLTVYLALLVCMSLAQLATAAWAVSYSRSAALLIAAVMGMSYVPFRMWENYETSPEPYATEYYLKLTLSMMLIYAAALYLAYRRWLRLDLA